MNASLDPTILDLVRGSAFAPMVDRPMGEVLRDMGLPQLPDLSHMQLPPLPDLPPMPVLDLHALAKPLTDLASGFGHGRIGAGPGPDPTQVLTQVSTALQTGMSLGSTALQLAMTLWQGMGAQSAATKAGQAASNGAALTAQSTQQKLILGNAATSAALGAARMSAIIAKYLTTMTVGAPLLGTPGGQAFLVAATMESMTEALAQVAKTKLEMVGHSASMTQAGQKVAITNAPTGVSSAQDVQQLLQLAQPLMTMVQTGTQAAIQLAAANTALSAPKSADDIARAAHADGDYPAGDGIVGGAGDGAMSVGVPGMAPVAAPLSPFAGTTTAAFGFDAGTSTGSAAAAAESASVVPGGTAGAASPGMVPAGGAGAAAAGVRSGAGDAGTGIPGNLVTAQHGDEVVGNLQGVTLPVVGAAEQLSEPPPDKALTL
ncbi:hypothetical protein ABIA39_008543 [Nocardia sp. GAS34]|uniref:hypothetical protein n=1 Tax=unclassified Nocardia TaxID=2637762 RepID=UPI003D196B91